MSWGMMSIAAAWTATPWAAVEIRQGAESMKSGPACTSLFCEGLVLLTAEGWRMHRPAGTLFSHGRGPCWGVQCTNACISTPQLVAGSAIALMFHMILHQCPLHLAKTHIWGPTFYVKCD